jgi:DNA-binding response OmpR family regulator
MVPVREKPPYHGGMKRVLVCDDEPFITRLVQVSLERDGFAVDTALDGQEAKEALQRAKYDLAILDYIMPRADGVEVVDFIRNELHSEMPVIIMTLSGDSDLIARAQKYSCVSVVCNDGSFDWSTLIRA